MKHIYIWDLVKHLFGVWKTDLGYSVCIAAQISENTNPGFKFSEILAFFMGLVIYCIASGKSPVDVEDISKSGWFLSLQEPVLAQKQKQICLESASNMTG